MQENKSPSCTHKAADLSDISAAFSKLWAASYPPEQLHLDAASTWTQVHPCVASWQQPAPCSDLLDDYNTLHITNFMANISINMFSLCIPTLHLFNCMYALHPDDGMPGKLLMYLSTQEAQSCTIPAYQRICWAHLGTMSRLALAYQRI